MKLMHRQRELLRIQRDQMKVVVEWLRDASTPDSPAHAMALEALKPVKP